MTQKPNQSIFYTASRIFWSIYFVLTIALVGFVMGYVITLSFYLLARLTKFLPAFSNKMNRFAEQVQCHSIRVLLRIQPWLNLKHNFHSIHDFYSVYKTRRILFVANHRSNLDTFFMISLIPGLRGLAKASLFSNVFFAPMMWAIGFVPVEKGNVSAFVEGLRKLRTEILDRDRAVLIFPETTRCAKNFVGVQKFSAAVFEVAIESAALIVPVLIRGSDSVLGRGELFLNPFQPVQLQLMNPVLASNFGSASDLSKAVAHVLKSEQQGAPCN